MIAEFERFSLRITLADAKSGSHPGDCCDDVNQLIRKTYIVNQLNRIGHQKIADELREYGAWDEEELSDSVACKRRIVWLACGDIVEEQYHRRVR